MRGEEKEGVAKITRRDKEPISHRKQEKGNEEGAHFRKAARREPIGAGMMDAVNELMREEKANETKEVSEKDTFLSIIEDHLSSGKEIKDEEINGLWQGFVKAHHVDDQAGLLKAFKSQGSEKKGEFDKYLARNFWDWVTGEREMAKNKPAEPVHEQKVEEPAKAQESEALAKQEKEQKYEFFKISVNPKKLERFADEKDKIKVRAFVEAVRSGKVANVKIDVDDTQVPPVITGIGIVALRIQGGKELEDRQYLPRELFTSVFENVFPYQRKEKGAGVGPVVGIGLLYAPKSFQSLQPEHPEKWKEILSRVKMEGVGFADKRPDKEFDVLIEKKTVGKSEVVG